VHRQHRADVDKAVPVDPWGAPYTIACDDDGEDVYVRSAGPDRRRGTADDVAVPKRRASLGGAASVKPSLPAP
jgi:hypothetical protein